MSHSQLLPRAAKRFFNFPLKYQVLRIVIAVALAAVFIACGSNKSGSNAGNTLTVDETNVAKVKVFVDGRILLNDKQVTIDDLKAAFKELKSKNGSVWYYRENASSEASPQAMQVIQAVAEAQLPIKLSTKPDFSDSVRLGGN